MDRHDRKSRETAAPTARLGGEAGVRSGYGSRHTVVRERFDFLLDQWARGGGGSLTRQPTRARRHSIAMPRRSSAPLARTGICHGGWADQQYAWSRSSTVFELARWCELVWETRERLTAVGGHDDEILKGHAADAVVP